MNDSTFYALCCYPGRIYDVRRRISKAVGEALANGFRQKSRARELRSFTAAHISRTAFGNDVAPFGKKYGGSVRTKATKLTVSSRTKNRRWPTREAGSYSLWAIPGEGSKWTMV